MALFILSFIAGVLTVAAPCVLPLLPVIVGGSVLDSKDKKAEQQWLRPLIIAASLAVSVIVFTLLIKASTVLLGVPQMVWQFISGGIVVLLGLNLLWPTAWEKMSAKLYNKSNAVLGKAYKKGGFGGEIVMGAALGPIFNSCSPTYALIVATILPVSFGRGLAYLAAYAIGMSATLLLIAYLGQTFVSKLRWLTTSWFRTVIAILFIAVGLAVIFGADKKFQTYVLDKGLYAPISNLEERLRN